MHCPFRLAAAALAVTLLSGCQGSADRKPGTNSGEARAITVTHHFHLPDTSLGPANADDPQNAMTSDFDASVVIDPPTTGPGKCATSPRHGDVNVPLTIQITNTSGDAWPQSTPNPWYDHYDSPKIRAIETYPPGRVEIVDAVGRGKCGAAGDNTPGGPWDIENDFTGLAYEATGDFSAVAADVPKDRLDQQTIIIVFYIRGYTRQQAPRWRINLGTGTQSVAAQALTDT